MKVVADVRGIALWFESPSDLELTIEQLQDLKREREENPGKSWPAFLGVFYARDEAAVKQDRAWLRWLRWALGGGSSTFSDGEAKPNG